MSIKYVSAVLLVKDVAKSRHFYEQVLGQKVLMDHGVNIGYEGGFAIWQADYAQQVIHGQPKNGNNRLGCDNLELYFEVIDLDAAMQTIELAGVKYVHPLQEQPWGQRVMRVYDPDGHIVELGEPMFVVIRRFQAQGLSTKEISQKTSMPEEIVEQICRAANE